MSDFARFMCAKKYSKTDFSAIICIVFFCSDLTSFVPADMEGNVLIEMMASERGRCKQVLPIEFVFLLAIPLLDH